MTRSHPGARAVPRAKPDEPRHWLMQPGTIRKLWWGGYGLLALTVLAQLAIPLHGHFGWDDWFGFYALYGFAGCVLMVAAAKLLALLVKRPDTYYDPPQAPAAESEHEHH